MAATRALRRLLRVLAAEEEQAQLALEAALNNAHMLRACLDAAIEREQAGRRWLAATVRSSEAGDRQAGLEEIAAACGAMRALRPRIVQAEARAAELREAFRAKHVERRQVETLIDEAEARQAAEAARRTQQTLDDIHLARMWSKR